ncbi:MAG: hypothetical protein U1E76_10000 [Planctomycetota bacterium]
MLAKEFAVMLPALLLILQLALRERFSRARVLDVALVAMAGGAYVVLRQATLATPAVSQIARQGPDEVHHYLFVLRALVEYLRIGAFPHPLTVDYGDRYFALPARGFLVTAAAATVLIVLLCLALRERAPWLPLGLAWFLVALFPTSNLLVRVKALVAGGFCTCR